jgi:hypothetical protein
LTADAILTFANTKITKKNLPPKKVARIDNDVDMNANISNSPRRYSNMDVNETCHYYLQVCHDMPKPKWWHPEGREFWRTEIELNSDLDIVQR